MPGPRLKWHSRATNELNAIVAYIAQDNIEAARKLRVEIRLQVNSLPGNPFLGRRGAVSGTRELVVRKNYIVVYAFTAETVTVLRVRHAAMDYPN